MLTAKYSVPIFLDPTTSGDPHIKPQVLIKCLSQKKKKLVKRIIGHSLMWPRLMMKLRLKKKVKCWLSLQSPCSL